MLLTDTYYSKQSHIRLNRLHICVWRDLFDAHKLYKVRDLSKCNCILCCSVIQSPHLGQCTARCYSCVVSVYVTISPSSLDVGYRNQRYINTRDYQLSLKFHTHLWTPMGELKTSWSKMSFFIELNTVISSVTFMMKHVLLISHL